MNMEYRIDRCEERFLKLSGEKEQVVKRIDLLKEREKKFLSDLKNIEKAQTIIQQVSLELQNQIKIHIEDIVDLALNSIFPDEYEFVINFVVKRNQTECELYLRDLKYNCLIDPIEGNGGGIVDVVSFALRIALWSLKVKKKNNTIILDEPFRFLSRDLQIRAGEMLQELSTKLNLQFIMVTHEADLMEFGDKIIKIKKGKGKSEVVI